MLFAILFRVVAEALRGVAADKRYLGTEVGAVAMLHTLGQALRHHPHLHCIVPGGGISPDQTRWMPVRPTSCWRSACSPAASEVFLQQLRAAFAGGELRFSGALAGLADAAIYADQLDQGNRVKQPTGR